MPGLERLTIAVPESMAVELQQAVAAGEYASPSEAIRDALRDWTLKRARRQAAIEEVRRAWDAGIASGPGCQLSLEEIKAEGRRRLQELREGSRRAAPLVTRRRVTAAFPNPSD